MIGVHFQELLSIDEGDVEKQNTRMGDTIRDAMRNTFLLFLLYLASVT